MQGNQVLYIRDKAAILQQKYHILIVELSFGLGSDRSGAANLCVHDGYLYIGGYNDPMIALPSALTMDFEDIYKDLSSPVCLWRLDENDNIEMVAGDANEAFPEGPIGNMNAGFNDNMNQYVWRMQSYDGQLYVGTFDVGSLAYPLMQFTNGDMLNMSEEEWKSQIKYIRTLIQVLKNKNQEASTFGLEVENDEMENSLANSLTEMKNIIALKNFCQKN